MVRTGANYRGEDISHSSSWIEEQDQQDNDNDKSQDDEIEAKTPKNKNCSPPADKEKDERSLCTIFTLKQESNSQEIPMEDETSSQKHISHPGTTTPERQPSKVILASQTILDLVQASSRFPTKSPRRDSPVAVRNDLPKPTTSPVQNELNKATETIGSATMLDTQNTGNVGKSNETHPSEFCSWRKDLPTKPPAACTQSFTRFISSITTDASTLLEPPPLLRQQEVSSTSLYQIGAIAVSGPGRDGRNGITGITGLTVLSSRSQLLPIDVAPLVGNQTRDHMEVQDTVEGMEVGRRRQQQQPQPQSQQPPSAQQERHDIRLDANRMGHVMVHAKPVDNQALVNEIRQQIWNEAVRATTVTEYEQQQKNESHQGKQSSYYKGSENKQNTNRNSNLRILIAVIFLATIIVTTIAVTEGIEKHFTDRKNHKSKVAAGPTTNETFISTTEKGSNDTSKIVPDSDDIESYKPSSPLLSETSEAVLDFLQSVLPRFSFNLLRDTSSPQYQSFTWLTHSLLYVNDSDYLSWHVSGTIQAYAMATLYYATNGDNWITNDGWLRSLDVCSWFQQAPGSHCNMTHQLITTLSLSSNGLVGTVPPELGLLTQLQTLDLSGNVLSGTIPRQIFHLTLLQSFNINGNGGISGTLPTDIQYLSRLQSIHIRDTAISGSLPTELGLLHRLEDVECGFTQLTGTLPSELGYLTSLELWSSRQTMFRGSLPTHIGHWRMLRSLDMTGAYYMWGTIPSALFRLTQLTALSLTQTGVSGTVPSTVGWLLNLATMELALNNLSGSLPTEFGLLTNLFLLDVSYNHFSSTIPTELGLLSGLSRLAVTDNDFSGTLPSELGSLHQLTELDCTYTKINGTIPVEFGNMLELQFLSLHRNRLSGTLPSVLAYLTDLQLLTAFDNVISGSFAAADSAFWSLSGLEVFGVGGAMTGTLPTTVGLATNLRSLYLNSNRLTGSVPSELGLLSRLTFLALADNLLSSSLPSELGQLRQMMEFHVEHNLLTGEVPSALGTKWKSIGTSCICC